MEISILGIDLAKNVFQLHAVNSRGKCLLKKKLGRAALAEFVMNLKPCIVAMEACRGSNYWARKFKSFGHEVRLIPAQYVKPFVKSGKNDKADAEAICEAASRPSMRFVAIKQIEQQDLQAIHRVRERLVIARTALSNEMRGLLEEYGVIIPQGIAHVRNRFLTCLEQHKEQLTQLSYELFVNLYNEFKRLDREIKRYDEQLDGIYKNHPACQLIATVPGVGSLTATAMLAAISDPANFKNGRQFAAWLGLVPRQHSSGGKEKLLGITKKGDCYLRKLLVHGARSTLRHAEKKSDKRSLWITELKKRRGANRASVALANKNARIIWTMLTKNQAYKPDLLAA